MAENKVEASLDNPNASPLPRTFADEKIKTLRDLMANPEPDEDAILKAMIEVCRAHLQRAHEIMRSNQEEIQQLKGETRQMISRLLAA